MGRVMGVVLALAPPALLGCATSTSSTDAGTSSPGLESGVEEAAAADGGEAEAAAKDGGSDAALAADGSGIDDGGEAGVVDGASDGGRDPTLQPFSSTGVWNLPIGSGAQWGATSDPDVAQLEGTSAMILAADYGKPFYVGTATDPLITLETTDKMYPVPTQKLHVPSSASFKLWMDMFDRTQPRYFWSSYNCSFLDDAGVTGGVTCSYTAVADVCGDGVVNEFGAGRYDWGVGTIRHWELEAGAIQHTLRYAVSVDVAKSAGPVWNQGVAWPDDNEDYDGPTAYKGELLFGSTIAIPASEDIAKLGLSSGGLVLARALQDHGAIMRDTTGDTNRLAFYAEPQDEDNPVLKQMRGDLPKITKVLRVMRNQSSTSVNGGGTPRAGLVPPIDKSVCP